MAQLTKRFDRNIWRYLYADGLNEIALGLFFLGMFGIRWLDHRTGLAWSIIAALPLLNAAAFIFLMRVVVERLRERITYPRLGYASYKPRGQSQHRALITVIAVAVAALSLQFALGSSGSTIDMSSVAIIGASMVAGLGWAWAGYSSGLVRFYLLAGVTFALPIALALLDLPATLLDFPVIIVCQAVLLITLGIWTLLRLLRMPVLEDDNDDVR
jgi:hypothetical protein